MYHIFKVDDYKGGELNSDVNLSKQELIKLIAERFYTDEDFTLDQWKAAIDEEILKEIPNHEGADGLGVIYKSKNGKLKRVPWRSLVDRIAEYKVSIK